MAMNWLGVLLWGFAGTLVLTTVTRGSQSLGLTRMDIPFMLGSIFTADRDRAKAVGFGFHLINGWVIACFYALIFNELRIATWWLGLGIGLFQGVFVLVTLLPLLPGLHPRM